MPTIRDLIVEALDGGKSVRDLAYDSGDRVKHQTFQELSKVAPKQFPKDPKTVAGMATALGYPETTIVLAYAKGLGIPVTGPSGFSARLPAQIDDLDFELQTALIAVARAALKQQGASDATDLSPASPAPPEGATKPAPAGKKTPSDLTDEELQSLSPQELRALAEDDTVWANYMLTQRPELVDKDWEF